jgi:hypothetical protein
MAELSKRDLLKRLDEVIASWLDDLRYTPSAFQKYPLAPYYPSDVLLSIQKKLWAAYVEEKKQQGDIYRRFTEDKDCRVISDNIREERIKTVLRKNYRRKHGDYDEDIKKTAQKRENIHNIPWLRQCLYEVADIYCRYKALETIKPLLGERLPGKGPWGRPPDTLKKQMLKKVFLLVYEAFTGRDFTFYPISFQRPKPSIVKPHEHSVFRVRIVQGYLPAATGILRLCGEYVSQKALEQIRDELREEHITKEAKRSGLEPVRTFYQGYANKEEKTFLTDWLLNIGLYKHPEAARKFLRTPIAR